MIPIRLGDAEENAFGGGIRFGGIGGRDLHFTENGVLWFLQGVVEVKLTVLGKVGVKGQPEKALFELILDERARGEIKEGGFLS